MANLMIGETNKNTVAENLYKKKQDIRVYMFSIAGQTAGPIGLKFFVDTHGWPGYKKFGIFFSKYFFPRATPVLQLVKNIKKLTVYIL